MLAARLDNVYTLTLAASSTMDRKPAKVRVLTPAARAPRAPLCSRRETKRAPVRADFGLQEVYPVLHAAAMDSPREGCGSKCAQPCTMQACGCAPTILHVLHAAWHLQFIVMSTPPTVSERPRMPAATVRTRRCAGFLNDSMRRADMLWPSSLVSICRPGQHISDRPDYPTANVSG